MGYHVPRAWLAYPDSPEVPVYWFDREEQWIGRGEGCHFILQDRYVSKRQAKIYWKENLLILEDYGHNPVLLNGEAIREVMLKDGDRLTIGSSEFVVRIEPVYEAGVDAAPTGKVDDYPEKKIEAKRFDAASTGIRKQSSGRKSAVVRLVVTVVAIILVIVALFYGAVFVYRNVLIPLEKRRGHGIEKHVSNSKVFEYSKRILAGDAWLIKEKELEILLTRS